MVAKVAGGIIGLGLISTGSVAIAKPEWFGINKEVPWTPLSQDKNFNSESEPYKDKFGGKHKNYLTGITGKEEGSNDAWWQKSYEQWKRDHKESNPKDNLGNEFKDEIKGAIRPTTGATTGGKYLKEICETIYKTTDGNIKADPAAGNTNEYKESSVWKYCSPLGQKPTTVKNHDNKTDDTAVYKQEGENKPIGKEEEENLISVNDKNNDKFWDIRNREFHGKDPFTTKVSIDENTDKFFKQGQTTGKHIKELCEEAYKKPSTQTSPQTSPTKDETKKYCSFGLSTAA